MWWNASTISDIISTEYLDKIVLELFKCINTNNDAIQNNVLWCANQYELYVGIKKCISIIKYLSTYNIPSFRIVILSLHKTNFDGEAGGGIESVQILIIKIKYKIALHTTALLFLLVTGNIYNTMRDF